MVPPNFFSPPFNRKENDNIICFVYCLIEHKILLACLILSKLRDDMFVQIQAFEHLINSITHYYYLLFMYNFVTKKKKTKQFRFSCSRTSLRRRRATAHLHRRRPRGGEASLG